LKTSLKNIPTLRQVQISQAKRNVERFAELCGFELDEYQRDFFKLANKQKRLVLNWARQSGKSTVVAIYALWCAIVKKGQLILIVSPSERQSGELFRKIRAMMRMIPAEMIPKILIDNVLSVEFKNGSRIVALPGKEKTVRSFSGVTLLIEDEAARVDRAMHNSVRPMLAVSDGSHFLLSTPFGQQGHFYDSLSSKRWEVLTVDARQNPRITDEFLEEELADMGTWWFNQEYLCIPMPDIDSIFSHEMIMNSMDDNIKPLFVGANG